MAALKQDHSTLPKAEASGGRPPDPQPRFAHLLARQLVADRAEAGEKATAGGTRIRHSDAGKCARAVAFKAAGGFPAQPMDPAGVHVTNLGTLVHDAWQAALRQEHGDKASVEVTCQVDGLDASGHIDAIIDEDSQPDPWRICYELKTTGGFSYKMAVGERGQPEGPKHQHIVQGCLNAYAVDADELVVGYLATEAISRKAAERAAKKGKTFDELGRFVAEWTFTRQEIEAVAESEVDRLQRVLELLDDGLLAPTAIPDPELPKAARIVDPSTGRWEVRADPPDGAQAPGEYAVLDSGEHWACPYCPWQDVCSVVNDPDATDLADARAKVEKAVPF